MWFGIKNNSFDYLFQYFDKYKNGVSQTAITISIIVVVVAIDIITGKLNIPINASVLKK